jgi:hypothetical protein
MQTPFFTFMMQRIFFTHFETSLLQSTVTTLTMMVDPPTCGGAATTSRMLSLGCSSQSHQGCNRYSSKHRWCALHWSLNPPRISPIPATTCTCNRGIRGRIVVLVDVVAVDGWLEFRDYIRCLTLDDKTIYFSTFIIMCSI